MAEDVVSRKILAIRAKAGNDNTRCPTCGHGPSSPYRRIHEGKISEGCIDPIHSAHVYGPSNSYDWHNSKRAKEHRRKELEHLESLGRRPRRS